MGIPLLLNRTSTVKSFTDVVYLTQRRQIPAELRKLIWQRKLSYAKIPFSQFPELRQRTHLIGTVIIDAEDMDAFAHQDVGQIIQSLEQDGVGVIVLTHRVEKPVRSFSLAPTKSSFSMHNTMGTLLPDELWTQISANLACRKKSPGLTCRPVAQAGKLEVGGNNKLASQLKMTGSLIENISEQLRLAGLVQRDFLPTQLPNSEQFQWATTFLPAEWVSGDIYNIIQLDERHIGFYIVDAVGHGMPAALLTIFVKQALCLRETIDGRQIILSPSEVLSRLNVKMAQQKFSGYQFATCCYCLLDTETCKLTYARAGHPYPILVKPGYPPEQLEAQGSLLGVFENAHFSEVTVQLHVGDKLILYSDGAEPFVGHFDDQKGFLFFEEFCDIMNSPVTEMMDRFITLTKTKEIDPSNCDDITMLGLHVAR